MLKTTIFSIVLNYIIFSLCSCNNLVKNEKAKIDVEVGTEIDNLQSSAVKSDTSPLGTYVGIFEADYENDSTRYAKNIYAGQSFQWGRENKISLFIDSIRNNNIHGHTVVAGNARPFVGTILKNDTTVLVNAKEPGNNKNDGAFSFIIKDTVINGTWKAFAKIEIEKRKYKLIKKSFIYNPDQSLTVNSRYIDWNKPEISKEERKRILSKMTKEEREESFELEEEDHYASATKKIYTINASNSLLSENEVANLTKGDILIIRNTIYARHGYSFKSRPLRVFFDKEPWYMPVNADIRNTFTDIKKKNIILLLKYEKIAKEFYDYFGRT